MFVRSRLKNQDVLVSRHIWLLTPVADLLSSFLFLFHLRFGLFSYSRVWVLRHETILHFLYLQLCIFYIYFLWINNIIYCLPLAKQSTKFAHYVNCLLPRCQLYSHILFRCIRTSFFILPIAFGSTSSWRPILPTLPPTRFI